jgi:hypothetical protein
VDWEDFKTVDFKRMSRGEELPEDTGVVTHTGVRVIYPDENAAYSQSVTRDIAETQGIITLKIPSTSNAKMYVLAVHDSENPQNQRTRLLGYVENFAIPEGSVTTITMSDIDWVEATWYPGEGYENFENGLTASKDEERYFFPIYVRDPFQIGEEITYSQSILRINGNSSFRDNTDGWRRFDISHRNVAVGTVHTEEYFFQPCVDYLLFNLPEGKYWIEPIANTYVVSWE